jgi:hypothetical protein
VLERSALFFVFPFAPREGAEEGAEKFLPPRLKHHFHDPVIGLALRRGDRSCVYIERDP